MMNDFERFLHYGRMRRVVKSVDRYSCVFEQNKKLYIALSTGQVIGADKFANMSDRAVISWLMLLFLIRGITPQPRTT